MGKQIVYCGGCGKSLREDDFARNKARTLDLQHFCIECRPPKPGEEPQSRKRTSTSHIPLATATPRRDTPAVEPTPRSRSPVLVAVVLVGLAAAVAAILLGAPRPGVKTVEPEPPPNAAAPETPVEKPPERPAVARRPVPPPERDTRLGALLEDVRKLREADPAFARRGDVLAKLGAALEIAGERRPEVERLKREYEEALDVRLKSEAAAKGAATGAAAPPPPPNAPPTVRIVAPPSAAPFTAPARILVTAEANDPEGKPLKVEFFEGARKLGEAVRFPFEFVWTDVGAGTYVLTVKATDEAGAAAVSPPVSVTVAPEPAPEPEVRKPQPEAPKLVKVPTPREALEDFHLRLKDSKTLDDKALAIQALGNLPVRDSTFVPAISRFLTPHSSDLNFLLPRTALDALSRFRGDRAASHSLQQAAESYKRVAYPGLRSKALSCLAIVGHESSLPVFEDLIRTEDPNSVRFRLDTYLRKLPSGLALDMLFRVWDEAVKEKAGGPPPGVQTHMVAFVQGVSGEPYKTMPELRHWWKLRGEAFKQKSAEAESAAAPAPPGAPGIPASLLVEFGFEEQAGASATNTGTSGAWFPQARLTAPRPARLADGARGRGLTWGTAPGPFAVDLVGTIPHLKDLKSFTIMGWLNCRAAAEGRGGNRIVSWLGKDGVELVWRSDGSLQLGVNEAAEASAARSVAGNVPVLANEKAAAPEVDRYWRFFAVTYDSTAASGHVKFVIGTIAPADAKGVATRDYGQGPVGSAVAPGLSVGHVPVTARAAGVDRMFCGAVDQLRIVGSTYDGAGALPLADLHAYQKW